MQHAGQRNSASLVLHRQHLYTFLQVDPAKYKGLTSSIGLIVREEGPERSLERSWSHLRRLLLQGMFKYGLYEFFKDFYSNIAGEEGTNKYKPLIWVVGSASAEVFADIALCPFEMTKVRIQTSPAGTFPVPFGAALAEMSRLRADTRYPLALLCLCGPARSRIRWRNFSSLRK